MSRPIGLVIVAVGMIREENISSYETKSNEKREIYCLVENITGT